MGQKRHSIKMIVYRNSGRAAWFFLLFTWRGSVMRHAVGAATIASLWCGVIIFYYMKSDFGRIEQWIDVIRIEHPLGGQIFTMLLAYALVFRTKMALARYEDGLTNVQVMLSKWRDSFCNIASFTEASCGGTNPGTGKARLSEDEAAALLQWRLRLCHWYSLMSALAFVQLRGCVGFDFNWVPIKELDFKRQFRENVVELSRGVSSDMSNMRRRKSRSRSVSNCVTNRRGMPCLISGAPPNGGTEERKERKWPTFTNNLDESERAMFCYFGKLDPAEVGAFTVSKERVTMIARWINTAVIERNLAGDLHVPPPILSRAVDQLSSGVEGYQQALKVSLCPFPFCFAQLIYYMLALYLFIIPVILPETTRSAPLWAACLCFMSTLGVFGISAISEELEDPYGDDMNDIPLLELHNDYLTGLEDCLLPSIHRLQTPRSSMESRNSAQFIAAPTAVVSMRTPSRSSSSSITTLPEEAASWEADRGEGAPATASWERPQQVRPPNEVHHGARQREEPPIGDTINAPEMDSVLCAPPRLQPAPRNKRQRNAPTNPPQHGPRRVGSRQEPTVTFAKPNESEAPECTPDAPADSNSEL